MDEIKEEMKRDDVREEDAEAFRKEQLSANRQLKLKLNNIRAAG